MEVKGFYCVSCKQRWICVFYSELLEVIKKLEDIEAKYASCVKFKRLTLVLFCPFRTEEV